LAGVKKPQRVFYASVPHLAAYFNTTQATVRAAIHHLCNIGFFRVLYNSSRGGDGPVSYRPLTHGEWEIKYGPGGSLKPPPLSTKYPEAIKCVTKLEMPWQDEDMDPLGLALHRVSGGRFDPYKNLIKGIRKAATKIGLDDESILVHFEAFVAQERPTGKRWVNGFAGRFVKYLKNVGDTLSTPPTK